MALLIGLAGAAGVIALATFLGSAPSAADSAAVAAPVSDQSAAPTPIKTVVDKVYVRPASSQPPKRRRAGREPSVATSRERGEREHERDGRERRAGQREASRGDD